MRPPRAVTTEPVGRARVHHDSLERRAGGPTRLDSACPRGINAALRAVLAPAVRLPPRSGHSADEAQDLTQGFFARILEKRTFREADPERGRFRSFLLASLKNFVANERERARANKRGGSAPPLSFEFETAEEQYRIDPPSDETPDKVFDKRWALTLLQNVLERLRTELSRSDKDRLFEQLKLFLTGERAGAGYAEVGARLGMSEGAVKVAVHRLRRRFRDLLLEEISQTVSSPDEVEDEIRHLWSSVGR